MATNGHAIPLIDVGALVTTTPDTDGWRRAADAIGAQIRAACLDTGFFYIVNHGVPQAMIDGAFAANRAFHARPVEEKMPLKLNAWHRGYQPMASTRMFSSARFAPAPAPNQLESFIVRDEISPDDPEYENRAFMGPNQWPDDADFRAKVETYFVTTRAFAMSMLPAYAAAVGEDYHFFDRFFDPPLATIRLIHYPPTPEARPDDWLGIYPHTDYGFFTTLAQDSIGGLEIQRVDGTWIAATPVAGAFVVNIGDALARWTNETFNSSPHRVINKSTSESRYSVAVFTDPNLDSTIACLDRFADAPGGVKHPPIDYEAYYRERMDSNHPDRRPAEAQAV